MKNFYSKILKQAVVFALFLGATVNAQTTYCVPTYSGWAVNEPAEPITLVQFGTGTGAINNSSTATVATSTPRYEDFSTISMTVQRGQSYDLKVKGTTNGNFTNYITVYFDWNGDGVFSNATPANAAAQQQLTNQPEKHQHTTAIVNSTGLDNTEMNYTVTIPNDAVIGQTRMRIVKNMNAPSSAPCANPFFPRGQVEDYTLNIISGTAVSVQSVNVTTQNNAAATIATANGTLQLMAAVLPSTVSQNVTWSVQSGNTVASVDNTGLVTGLTNGTAVIRATSVTDTSKYGELTVTVNIPTAPTCTVVQTFLETFEAFTTFPENCWTANLPNYPNVDLIGTTNQSIQLYSGGQANDVILVSPEVSTIDGQHQLVFDIVLAVGQGTQVQIGTMTDNTDFSTFAAVGTPFTPTVGSYATQAIAANAGHKYVAIRFIHGGGHGKILVVDNVEWKQVTASTSKFNENEVAVYPNPTTGIFTIETALDVKQIDVYNALGQKVLTTNNKQINLQAAANGIYFVTVTTTNNLTGTYKLIKK